MGIVESIPISALSRYIYRRRPPIAPCSTQRQMFRGSAGGIKNAKVTRKNCEKHGVRITDEKKEGEYETRSSENEISGYSGCCGGIEHARMRDCSGLPHQRMRPRLRSGTHSPLWNKCVFIAAVAVAALLLKPAAARAASSSSLSPPSGRAVPQRCSSYSWSAPREVLSQMGPSDLHKAVHFCTHTATRWPPLIKRARAFHAHAYPLLRAQRTSAHHGTQKRRACLVALTIRPPTYEISRFIIIPVSALCPFLFPTPTQILLRPGRFSPLPRPFPSASAPSISTALSKPFFFFHHRYYFSSSASASSLYSAIARVSRYSTVCTYLERGSDTAEQSLTFSMV